MHSGRKCVILFYREKCMNNKFFKNHINLKDKNLKWYNTNLFYISTLIMTIAIIISYVVFKSYIDIITSVNNFWNVYLMTFSHGGVPHITFNIIMFILSSLLLERHFGSFTYLIMLIIIIPLANLTCFAVESFLFEYDTTWTGCGASCVTYFLLGFVCVVALFNYRKYFMSKNAFIFFIPLAINIFFSSVNSNNISSPADFFAHPSMSFMYAFRNTSGHFATFIAGLVIGVLIFTVLSTTKISNKKSSVQ